MKTMKLSITLIFILSSLFGFSAFSTSQNYVSVFKKNVQKNTTNDFQTNLTQDVQKLYNILRQKKAVAVLETTQKKTDSENGNLALVLK
ncbi:MAG: hypothetical protein OXB86_02850 [Bdellovibrionales bacterium]|nr:hypothetical protein [Bdellovibrionales bacterium]